MELAILFFACVGVTTSAVASAPYTKRLAAIIRYRLIKRWGAFTFDEVDRSRRALEADLRHVRIQLEKKDIQLRIARAQLTTMRDRYTELEQRIDDTETHTAPLRRPKSREFV